MTTTIVVIFLVVYLGMILGELPFLRLDRTRVALLGAIALISFDAISLLTDRHRAGFGRRSPSPAVDISY